MSEHTIGDRWWRDAERDAIHSVAAQWFTRLQDPQVSLDVTVAWQQWMAEDARHAEAYARLEEVWNTLGELPPETIPPLAPADPDDASRSPNFLKVLLVRWPRIERWATAASVVVAVLLGVAAISHLAHFSWAHNAQLVTTAVGENRSVRLEDGSRVILGGDTELETVFRNDVRRISLVHGEAFFKVAKDPARPFVVQAGNTAVTAVGTEFDVRSGADRVTVAVLEGRVVVGRSSRLLPLPLLREFKPKLVPVQVQAGEQTTISDGAIKRATGIPDPSTPTAWQSGRLVYNAEALRYVLADVNRYAAKPIVAGDETIGSLTIIGTVSSDNVEEWIQSLESAFGLVAVEEPNRIVLMRDKAK